MGSNTKIPSEVDERSSQQRGEQHQCSHRLLYQEHLFLTYQIPILFQQLKSLTENDNGLGTAVKSAIKPEPIKCDPGQQLQKERISGGNILKGIAKSTVMKSKFIYTRTVIDEIYLAIKRTWL